MRRGRSHEEFVLRSMRRTKFDNKVQTSFFITIVNNGLPLVFFAAVCLTAAITKSLYTTGYLVLAIAVCMSLAYTLWYFVTYMIVYVLFYIKKMIQTIWTSSTVHPTTKKE